MINFIQEVIQNNNPIAINQKLLSIQISKGFQLLSEHTKQQLSCSQPEAAHSSESKTSIHEVSELQNRLSKHGLPTSTQLEPFWFSTVPQFLWEGSGLDDWHAPIEPVCSSLCMVHMPCSYQTASRLLHCHHNLLRHSNDKNVRNTGKLRRKPPNFIKDTKHQNSLVM